MADWALQNIRLDGLRFSFEGHEYLRALYDDRAQHIVVCKAAQVGGTTWAVLRSIHACLSGLNVMYFFPTRTDVLDFSKSRVAPLLADNPVLSEQITDTDTAGLKRIADAYLYFRGMKSTVGMKSVPADMIVFDELDEATPEAKAMAKERLAHSDYKRVIELSNPSLPGYGIDEVFQQSDQRHWTVKCPGCGEWTALDKEYPLKVGQEVKIILPRGDGSYFRACPKCEVELDLAAGEWVPDFPDQPIHGYRISQLISARVDASEILADYQLTRYRDRHYNLKIGVPWADLERRLDIMSVLSLCSDAAMLDGSDQGCFMGVDTGKDLHVVILRPNEDDLRHQDLVYLGVCPDFAALDLLIARFRVDCCVIDGLPETHATREFAARHRGKVYMSFFNENQRGELQWDHHGRTVQVNRTEALDMSRAAIRERKVTLPRRDALVELFSRHMSCDAKQLDEDPDTGMKKYRYIRTGEDHFSLAFTYAMLAASDYTQGWGWSFYLRQRAIERERRKGR